MLYKVSTAFAAFAFAASYGWAGYFEATLGAVLTVRYSLLSRFRGAILGAALGDLWAVTIYSRSQNSPPVVRLVEKESCAPIADPAAVPMAWGAIATTIAQTLVHSASPVHQWRDWVIPSQVLSTSLGGDGSAEIPEDPAGWAIATLPLLLCYHDDFSNLRSHLDQIPGVARSEALILGYTLARILRNQLSPATLIAQLLTDLDLEHTDWVLADQLAEVAQLICSGASLAIAHRVLQTSTQSSSMSFALYCFLRTPEEYRLSLLSTRDCAQPTLTSALVGALSGCMNTTAGLSIYRRNSFQKHSIDSLLLQSRWGVETETALLDVADLLLAHWAGVYRPHQMPLTHHRWAIAAPNVIRPL